MFESLSDKLKRTLKNLRGEGVLTKEHVEAALREIRLALLEADVNYKVAKDFIVDVGFKQREPDLTQSRLHVLFRQHAFAAQILQSPFQLVR